MATYTWVGGNGANWTTLSSWEGGLVPSPSGNATFGNLTPASPYTAEINSSVTIGSISITSANATLQVEAYSGGALTLGGTLTIDAGTFEISGSNSSGAPAVTGGTIDIAGGTLESFAEEFLGTTFQSSTGTVVLDFTTLDNVVVDGTLNVTSIVEVDSGSLSVTGATGTGPGEIDIAQSFSELDVSLSPDGTTAGTVDLNGGNIVVSGQYSNIYQNGGTIENVGTIVLSGAESSFNIEAGRLSDVGAIDVSGAGANVGFYGAQAFDDLVINIGAAAPGSASPPGSPPATAELIDYGSNGSSLTFGPGTVINQTGELAAIDYQRGSIEAAVQGFADAANTGGGIVSEGTVNAGFAGGEMAISGPFTNDGAINIGNGDTVTVTTFVGNFVNASPVTSPSPPLPAGQITIDGGTLDVVSGTFDNAGTITIEGSVEAGTTLSGLLTVEAGTTHYPEGATWLNTGTVNIESGGTLDIAGSMSPPPSPSPVNIAAGGTLEFQAAIIPADLAGITNSPGGALIIDGPLDNSSNPLDIGAGTGLGQVTLGPDGVIAGGTILDFGNGMQFEGGTLFDVAYLDGPTDSPGTIELGAGESLSLGGIVSPTNVNVGPGATLDLISNPLSPLTLSELGGITNSGGTVNIDGTLQLGNGTLDAGTDAALGPVALEPGGYVVGGTIDDTGNGSGASGIAFAGGTLDGVTYTFDGSPATITVESGETLALAHFPSTTLVDVESGGTLELVTPFSPNLTAGELAGITNSPGGAVVIDGWLDNFTTGGVGTTLDIGQGTNLGVVTLGPEGTVQGGTIVDNGNEMQFAGGTFNDVTYQGTIELASPGSDLSMNHWVAGQKVALGPGGFLALWGSPVPAVSPGASPPPAPPAYSEPLDITETGGALTINADVGSATLANVTNTDGGIYIFGTLDNTGQTLNLGPGSQLGSVSLQNGGEIEGGTIAADGTGLGFASPPSFASMLLDGVTYQGTLTTGTDSWLYVGGGLTVEGPGGTGGGSLDIAGYTVLSGTLSVGTTDAPGTITLGRELEIGNSLTLDNATVEASGTSEQIYTEDFTVGRAAGGGYTVIFPPYSPPPSPTSPPPAPPPETLTFGPHLTFDLSPGSGLTFETSNPDSVINDGTINDGDAVLSIAESFTNNGEINVGTGETGSFLDGSLTVDSGTFDNSGVINLGAAVPSNSFGSGDLNAEGAQDFVNTGTINIQIGGELDLGRANSTQANWSNSQGTITDTDGILYVYGDFTTGQLGTVEQLPIPPAPPGVSAPNEQFVQFSFGTIDNTGATLDIGPGSALGRLYLDDFTIQGGTIDDLGKGLNDDEFSGGDTLDGVTYEGTLDFGNLPYPIIVENGLTFEGSGGTGRGAVVMDNTFSGLLEFADSGTLSNVNVDIATAASTLMASPGATLTLSPSVTITQGGSGGALDGGGAIVNDGAIDADYTDGTFTIDPGTFTNNGTINVSNGNTAFLRPTSFTNRAGGTLTGGTYDIVSGSVSSGGENSTLELGAGDTITTLAADLTLDGPGSVVNANGSAPIESTLAAIGSTGTLSLLDARGYTTSNTLTDAGLLNLGGGTLSADGLTVSPHGALDGFGAVATTSPVANDGTITASGGLLKIDRAVSGTAGSFDIAADAQLELGGASAENVSFNGNAGLLKLDDPHGFGGAIDGLAHNDEIDLVGTTVDGLSLTSGTLTIDTTGGTLTYDVAGDLADNVFSPSSDGNGGTDLLFGTTTGTTLAAASVSPSSVTLPKVRVGSTTDGEEVVGQFLTIKNTAAPSAGLLEASVGGLGGNVTGVGSISALAPGQSNSTILVYGSTDVAGAISGAVTLDFSSDNDGTITGLADQVIDVTGGVYRPATATLTAPTLSSPLHIGSPVTETLTLTNTAPNDGYSEALIGSAGSVGGELTDSGTTGVIAPGGTSGAISVTIHPTKAGTFDSPVAVGLTTDGTGIDGLGEAPDGSVSTQVTATVNNYADPVFNQLGTINAGTSRILKQSPTAFTFNFQADSYLDSSETLDLNLLNDVLGPADQLSGSYEISGITVLSPGSAAAPAPAPADLFINTFSPFVKESAGIGDGSDSIVFNAKADGPPSPISSPTFNSETITLKPVDSNPSGLSETLSPVTLTVDGEVTISSAPSMADLEVQDHNIGRVHTYSPGLPSNSPRTITIVQGISNNAVVGKNPSPGGPSGPWLDAQLVSASPNPYLTVTVAPLVGPIAPNASDFSSRIQLSLVNAPVGQFSGTVTAVGASVFGPSHSLISPLPSPATGDFDAEIYGFAKPYVWATSSNGHSAVFCNGTAATGQVLDLGTVDGPTTVTFYASNNSPTTGFYDNFQGLLSPNNPLPGMTLTSPPGSPIQPGAQGVVIGMATVMPLAPGSGSQTGSVTLTDNDYSQANGANTYSLIGALPDPTLQLTEEAPNNPPPPPPPHPPKKPVPLPNPPPPASPNLTDVHITTFSGLYYNFQAAGEFVAAESANPAEDPFEVQIRLQPYFTGASVSVITAVAAQVGTDRVTFDLARANANGVFIWLNGSADTDAPDAADPTQQLNGGTLNYLGPDRYSIDFNDGRQIAVTDDGGILLNLVATLAPTDVHGSVQGLDGTFSGTVNADLTIGPNGSGALGGTLLSDTFSAQELYGAYANSWRVSPNAPGAVNPTLFDYTTPNYPNTGAYTDKNFPGNPNSYSELPEPLIVQATLLAAQAGITDPTLLQDAILDYAETGNPAFITDAANQQALEEGSQKVTNAQVTSPPQPAVSVVAEQTSVDEAASGATSVTFDADLTGTVSSPVTVDYQVAAPTSAYLGNSAFSGDVLPTGSITIAKGSDSASFTINVSANALGAEPSAAVGVEISTPTTGVTVAGGSAQTEIDNRAPVAGPPAQIGLELASGGGTLSQSGNAWTLNLGDVVRGTAVSPTVVAADNLASPLSDDLSGAATLGSSGGGFTNTFGGYTDLAPGGVGDAAIVTLDTNADGIFTETIDFSAEDTNVTGYSAALTGQTLTVTGTVDPAGPNLTSVTGAYGGPITATGAGESGDTVSLFASGMVGAIGTGTVEGGVFTITTPGTFTDGVYTLRATETDPSGLVSGSSGTLTLDIDPPAPSLTSVTGAYGGPITATGAGTNGDTVSLFASGMVGAIGTGTVEGGVFTITTPGTFTDGVYTLRATETDPSGLVSGSSGTLTLDIDPPAPSLTNVTGAYGDPIVATGAGTNGDTVSLFASGMVGAIGTGTVEGGVFTITTPGTFTDGVYTLRATETDPENLTSASSGTLTLDIDPPAPSLTNVTGAYGDPIVASGAGESGDTVSLSAVGLGVIGTGTVEGGVFTVTTPGTVTDGVYTLSVTETDPENLTSASSGTLALDIDPPAPSLTNVTGAYGDPIVASGAGESGDTVSLSAVGLGVIGTGTVEDGVFTVTTPGTVTDGVYTLSVTETDPENLTSASSGTLALDIDPPAPSLTNVTGAYGDPIVATGAGESGDTVSLFASGMVGAIGTGTVEGGVFTVTTPGTVTDGVYTLSVTETDPENLTSASSGTLALDIDPPAPSLTNVTGAYGDPIVASGAGESGDTVSLSAVGLGVIGTGTVEDGVFTVTTPGTVTDGVYTLSVTETDPENLTSASSGTLALDIDPPAPSLTNVTGAYGDPIVATGAGESGDTVSLFASGMVGAIGTGTVEGGVFTITTPGTFTDGVYTVRATETDPENLTSASSGTLTVDIDPPAPSLTNVTGAYGDPIVASGAGESGDTVSLFESGMVGAIGTGTVEGGVFTITTPGTFTDGVYTLRATETDPSGLVSGSSGTLTLDIDPPAPSLTNVTGAYGDPIVASGAGESGDTVSLSAVGLGVIGTGTVEGGVFTITTPGTVTDGVYPLSVTETDPENLTSASSGTLTLDIDPPAPSLTSGSGANGGPITVTGTGEMGDKVSLFEVGEVGVVGTTTVGTNGTFTVTTTGDFATGTYDLSATESDASNLTSASSNTLAVVVVASGTVAPPVLTAVVGQPVNGGTVTVMGTGHADDAVALYADGGSAVVGTGTVGTNGTFTITTTAHFTDGVHKLTATEAVGNQVSKASGTLTVDVDPNPPALTSVVGQPVNGSSVTVTGTGETGDKVTLLEGTQIVGTGTVGANGTFTITTTTHFADGTCELTAIETDTAKLTSASSNALPVDVDPSAPKLTKVVGKPVNGGPITVTGTGENGDTVSLFAAGMVGAVGSATVSGGVFTITTTTDFADGTYTLSAAETDTASLTSAPSATLTADVYPGAPTLTGGSGVNGGQITVTGTGEVGDAVTLLQGGKTVGTGLVGGDSTFTITTTTDFAAGTYNLTATETDTSDLTSASSNTLAVVATVPEPALTGVVGQPVNGGHITVTGTGQAGDSISLYADGGLTRVGTGTVGGDGSFTITTTAGFADGVHELTATEFVGSHASASSSPLTVDVDPSAPKLTKVVGNPVNGGAITVTGTGENGDTVSLFAAGMVGAVGSATVSGGVFTITTTTDFSNGTYDLTATETDTASLTSASSNTLAVVVPVPAPVLTAVLGQPVNGGTVTVTGTGQTGDKVALYADGGSTAVGNGVVGTNGTFTITTTADFTDGAHKLTATEASGNQVSKPSGALTVDVDPNAPSLTSGLGVNGGPITVTGTGEAGDKVTLFQGSKTVGTGTVGTNGTFTITTTTDFTTGSYNLTATETDKANLTSLSSPALAVSVPAGPAVTAVSSSPTSGDFRAGTQILITLQMSEAVTVAGTVGLSLNDGGTASYDKALSSPTSLVFAYTAGAGQNTSDLTIAGVTLGKNASVKDAAGNNANFAAADAGLGLMIDTKAPTVTEVGVLPADGTLLAGSTATITLDMSEAVIVSGTPTLSLNDGGTAVYDRAESTSTALAFDYTVEPDQVSNDLGVTGAHLPGGASIDDGAGNRANLSGADANLGLQVNGAAGTETIAGNETLTILGASAVNVDFAPGATGTLQFYEPWAYGGSVSGLAGGDAIDLPDVPYINLHGLLGIYQLPTLGYTENKAGTGGDLTASEGPFVLANISLLGSYMASSFVETGDGHGGTLISIAENAPNLNHLASGH